LALLVTLALTACTGSVEQCSDYGQPQEMGQVGGELDEASGLAISRQHENLVWAHNDKGDSARIFALGLNASERGTFVLTGVDAVDFEDMAAGPDGELWIADIGDNDNGRPSVSLLRVDEPGDPDTDAALSPTVYELEYEDRPLDAEAMFVDDEGQPWVIDKVEAGSTRLYRADLDAGLLVEELAFKVPGSDRTEVTAADLGPDGDRLVLRTPDLVLVYDREIDQDMPEVLEGSPCSGPSADEDQGESIALSSWGYLTLGEGQGSTLFRYNQAD
jgi:hypothetical protein